MKRLLVIVLALTLVLGCSVPAFASGGQPMTPLEGEFGAPESVRGDGSVIVRPFYLAEPQQQCVPVQLAFSIMVNAEYGDGSYDLYAKDSGGRWHFVGVFTREGQKLSWDPDFQEVRLGKGETLIAAAFWSEEEEEALRAELSTSLTLPSEPSLPKAVTVPSKLTTIDKTGETLSYVKGKYAKAEYVRKDLSAYCSPLYLEKPVYKCSKVKLEMTVVQKSGYCGGNYYLYVKDTEGTWSHVGLFKVEKKDIDGELHSYEIKLDGKKSFIAVAVWPADKGMDFSAEFDYTIAVPPECVSEYSSQLPAPKFEPADEEIPLTSTHVSDAPYAKPPEPKG